MLSVGLVFGGVSLWNQNGDQPPTFRTMLAQYEGVVTSLAFNDTNLLTVGCDRTIAVPNKPEKKKFDGTDSLNLWDWEKEEVRHELFDDAERVMALCYKNDFSMLAVAYVSKEINEIGDEVPSFRVILGLGVRQRLFCCYISHCECFRRLNQQLT